MADYDVAALALASPPTSTPPATYTPAISVRNNGLHDAIATGWLTFYRKTTGVLVAQFNVTSGTIHAGATGNATADGTLDLSAEPVGAQFIVTGYVTTTNDQVESNNPLAPVIITISAEPPPPPPPVAAHASQHEEAGGDELHVDGLHGKLLDPQEPEAHALEHQVDGDDELDVTGLAGVLAEAQTPKLHANEAHAEAYITTADIPAIATPQRWQPSIFETTNVGLTGYLNEGLAPNVGGSLAQETSPGTALHSGAFNYIELDFDLPDEKARTFLIHMHTSALVIGNASLTVRVTCRIQGIHGTLTMIEEDVAVAANSDQDTLIVDAHAVLQQRADGGIWWLDATGDAAVLYPAGPAVPNQIRRCMNQPQISQFGLDCYALLQLQVTDGDANNYLVPMASYIRFDPAVSPPPS